MAARDRKREKKRDSVGLSEKSTKEESEGKLRRMEKTVERICDSLSLTGSEGMKY